MAKSETSFSYVLGPVDTKGQEVTFFITPFDDDVRPMDGGVSCPTANESQIALITFAGRFPSIVVSVFFHESCEEWIVGVFGKEVEGPALFEFVDA